jgi:hypothetical protein
LKDGLSFIDVLDVPGEPDTRKVSLEYGAATGDVCHALDGRMREWISYTVDDDDEENSCDGKSQ